MSTRFCLQAALSLAALATFLALPISLFAQFQPPTSEELALKEEPKAPGAAAIYLYREETVDDNLHYHSFFARIKVLTEKGKEVATVGVPYPKGKFSVTDIKARTIHADGAIIPLDVKPSDLLVALNTRSGGQVNKMVFTLPSVEVGSILEYKWQLRYDDEWISSPDWDIQQPYYVRKAHYSFIPYKYMYNMAENKLLYSYMLPDGAKVVQEASGRYTLDVANLPAIPNEDYMPPLGTLIEQVHFYYSSSSGMDDYWKHEGGSWSKEMDHFASETKPLKEAVAQIVAAGDSEDVKARKLYDAVMALDNTDYTRRKSKEELKREGLKRIKDVEGVWKQKSGSSDEIALLYLAMARIAGLKAHAMLLCNRDLEVFNPYFMSMRQLDDVLVVVTINGKEQPLDPGKRFATFGQLAWKHTLSGGLRQSDKGAIFVETPGNAYKDAVTLRVADVNIALDGAVSGTARVAMNGPAATRWRELAVENDEDEVKKQFNEYMRALVPDGVTADFDHFLGLNDYHSQLMGIVTLSGNMGTKTGKRIFLPGIFFASHAKHPFVADDKRQTTVDMEYAEDTKDVVTYNLPDSFSVESAPTDTNIPWTGHAVLQLKSTVDKNKIEVDRTLVRAFTLVVPKDYSALHDFYQKVATADQQQLVLTATASSGK